MLDLNILAFGIRAGKQSIGFKDKHAAFNGFPAAIWMWNFFIKMKMP